MRALTERYHGGVPRTLVTAVTAIIVAVGLGGCVERPTAEECDAMAEHVVTLFREAQQGRAAEIAGEVAQSRADSLSAGCRDNGTAPEVRCVLAAADLDQVRACAPEG